MSSDLNIFSNYLFFIFYFFLLHFPTRIPFRTSTGCPHRLGVGAFDPNIPPYNPASFLDSPRVRACTRTVVWENLNATKENPHQEQRAEESNLSILWKTSSGYPPLPAG